MCTLKYDPATARTEYSFVRTSATSSGGGIYGMAIEKNASGYIAVIFGVQYETLWFSALSDIDIYNYNNLSVIAYSS